ncbi:MAG: hypothetical protein JWR07_1939 [Nevskia sp.]|nr:hypothetical protein [Nevskia sp.]
MEISFTAIQQLCNVCTATGCWHWKGGVASGGVPQMRAGPGTGPIKPVRAVVLQMLGKWRQGDHLIATNTCRSRDCVAPEHVCWLTRKELQQRTAKETRYGECPERRLAISKVQRARSPRTIEMVREMRASGLSTRAAAKVYGCAQSTAALIMCGGMWKDHQNPFAGLGAR